MTHTAEFLLGTAARGSLLLVTTMGAVLLARRSSASLRHALWCAGLWGLLLVPGFSLGLPRWTVITLPAQAVTPVEPSAAAAETGAPLVLATETTSTPAPPPSVRRADPFRVLRHPGTLAVVAWASGTTLLLLRLLVGHLRVRALVARSHDGLGAAWRATADEVMSGTDAGTRLLVSDGAMPMATGIFRPLILLPASGAEWSPAHRRDVLIHELAHVRRRDCLTHFGIELACALHWFNPLVWIAARQARVEREHACDDAVLGAGAVPSSYADELLQTARTAPVLWGTSAAGLSMARPSHLAGRLLAVLDSARIRRPLGRRGLVYASMGALAVAGPISTAEPTVESFPPLPPLAQPRQSAEGVCRESDGHTARSVRLTGSMTITGRGTANDGKGNTYVAWTGEDCSMVIHVYGTPVFTQGEDDVMSLSAGGRFTLTEVIGSVERVYDVRERGGRLERGYRVDGAERALDESARRWVAEHILEFIRQSGYDAPARTRRILEAGGEPALLREIEAIRSDWARSLYYRTGISAARAPAGVRTLVQHADAHLPSDYETARVLQAVPATALRDAEVQRVYVAAVGSMESDYEKARTLIAASSQGLTPSAAGAALQATTTMQSDYERARVLLSLLGAAPADQPLDPRFYESSRAITSSYERSRVLSAIAQRGAPAAGQAIRATDCAAVVDAAAGMDSDFEKAKVLSALVSAGASSADCAVRLFGALTSFDSDHERAQVLLSSVNQGALTEASRGAFFEATGGIESDFNRRQVLIAVVGGRSRSETMLIDVLGSAGDMSSDFERAQVLLAVAGSGRPTPKVRSAYLKAAYGMSSDYERERALRAIGEDR